MDSRPKVILDNQVQGKDDEGKGKGNLTLSVGLS